jgi:hypothetical protein
VPTLDTVHDVPDKFQIDLGNEDCAVGARVASRNGHVRFRFIAEVDRPVVCTRSASGEVRRIVGTIRLTSDHIDVESRDAQLFPRSAVRITHFQDRGSLAQQAQQVAPSLIPE